MSFTYAGQWGPDSITSRGGIPLPSLSIQINNAGGGAATLYTDRTKATGASNPTATDAEGNLSFFADPGDYTLVGNGGTITVSLGADPAEPVQDLGGLPTTGGTMTGPIAFGYAGTSTNPIETLELSGDAFPRWTLRADGRMSFGSPNEPTFWGNNVGGNVGAGSDFAAWIEQLADTSRILHLQFPRFYMNDGTNYLRLTTPAFTGASLNSTQNVVVDVGSMAGLASSGTLTFKSIGYGDGTLTYTGKTGSGSSGTLTGCTSSGITYNAVDASRRWALMVDDAFGAKIMGLGDFLGLDLNDNYNFRYSAVGTVDNTHDIIIGFQSEVVGGGSLGTGSAVFFGGDGNLLEYRTNSLGNNQWQLYVDSHRLTYDLNGLYPQAAEHLGTSISPWGIGFISQLRSGDGTAAAPALTFVSDVTTGIYKTTASGLPVLGFSLGGAEILQLNAGVLYPITNASVALGSSTNRFTTTHGGLYLANQGSAGAPTYAWELDATTGLYMVSAGEIGVSVSGNQVANFQSTGLTMAQPIAMGTQKITGLGNGSASDDAAAFGQIASAIAATSVGAGVYGDGSDSAVAFDGTNTFAGFATTSGGAPNLIYTLTRDIYCTNITVSSGKIVNTAGFRIFFTGTCTNNGTIQDNGGNASGITAGTAAPIGSLGGGGGGGNGGATTTNGSNGTGHSLDTGGSGSAGGNSAANAHTGGTAGIATVPTAAQGLPRCVPASITGCIPIGTPYQGAGGGGGGAGGTANTGGGGGGGAGVIVIAGPKFAGTGTIQCLGGNGANGAVTSGGGGAGGGGTIIITTQANQIAGGTVTGQTLTVTPGTPGTNGGGTGFAGGTAASGSIFLVSN